MYVHRSAFCSEFGRASLMLKWLIVATPLWSNMAGRFGIALMHMTFKENGADGKVRKKAFHGPSPEMVAE
jgi:hypothetical protein